MYSIESYKNLFPVIGESSKIRVLSDSDINQIEVIS